ncbi:hypothetical protein CONCODRAFT_10637 [Conidiobolus coronatus NRRL 28638]|uniref:Uncharacterized protein n=1 Tax=Conidiobolus coronatus (strain ATCC 28846 / CBS 209.66 / NRRL 28638) TaxID=796925 RepID=A0A137NX45_CONC2|nr:hypothetical protein CONCODRAFT_10637 [Conidiobolus coronatus NRRL 28638]|eukprot:KXN67326.1 hypothetical protein CONCODRAFT_10637 [Conidiobolus coronatus NRRL 28638]
MPNLSCNIAVANSPCTFSNDKQTDSGLSNTLSPTNIRLKDNTSISQTFSTFTSTNHKQSLSYTNMNSNHFNALLDEPGTNQIFSNINCAPVLQFIKLQSSSVLLNPYPITQKQSTE